ncbi:MAG: lytic transglycosylase domain-containing protein [Ignavibacteriales bacterium]|nr:MAG: lytic transglycosylase domain-containing protein [Ignavibacteriales bacterium]
MSSKSISRVHVISLYLLLAVSMFFLLNFYVQIEEQKVTTHPEPYPQNYRIVVPPIPENIEIFGERVPLEDIDVRERLEREIIVNTYWHSSTLLMIKKAKRWFPIIEPILEKNNIPDDVKYISVIESNLDNVVSPAGATGFWQFMKGTAPKYNIEIRDEVDERYHLEKSTQAACEYLLEAYEKFGSWATAAASYNMGIDGVRKQIERQRTSNYYNFTLNPETSRYLFRAIAMKLILINPEVYGFNVEEFEKYKPYETYEIEVTEDITDLAIWAKNKQINYKWLKILNPWLRDNFLKVPKGKSYKIKLPEPGSVYIIPD